MQHLDLLSHPDDYQLLPAGQVIFEEGDPGGVMFVILEGEVSVMVEGREIDRLFSGSILGEMALVDERPRSATATAATDCRMLSLDQERFMRLIQKSPDFAVEVMRIMSSRLRRLMEEEVTRQRMEEELRIGRRIQLSLLPERLPDIDGWEFAALYRSARQVGGDLYDFFATPEDPDRLHIVIADVTGKGVPAALFMAAGRMALRTEMANGRSPDEALQQVNQLVSLDSRHRLFLSAFQASLETKTGRLTFANAGHDWPLWQRHDSGAIQTLSSRGLVLGVFKEIQLEEQAIDMAPGDCLILYTDGVTEARNSESAFFGEEGLEAVIGGNSWDSAEALHQAIVHSLEEFTGDFPLSDDLTLVVIRRKQGE
jgi:sigma-B regulation protein RsbU (phosphoserine phosphatase)